MNNVERLLRAAKEADTQGQIEAADRLCREVLYLKQDCADALLLAGSIAARRGRNEEAIALLRKAAAADANSYDASRWLAGLLMGRAGGKEAIGFAENAVRLRPKQFEAHVLLGMALVSIGENEEAVDSFRKAVDLNGKSAGAHHNLGVAYQRAGDPDLAVEELQRALALSPGTLVSLLHLGKAHLENGDPRAAVACFEQAVEFDPNCQSARALLADATFVAIHDEHGEEYMRRTLEAFPNEGYPHALFASWLQEQGRFEEASASIDRSIALSPKQGFAYYLYTNNQKMRDADRPFLQKIEAVAADPSLRRYDMRYAHFALGKAYDDLKEYEKAIHHLDLANEQESALESEVPSSAEAKSARRARAFQRAFPRELFDRIGQIGLEDPAPIFIFGMPRSGTTLLEQIVSRHSNVGAAGEQVFWRDNRRKIVDVRKGSIREGEVQRVAQKYLDLLHSIAPGKERVTEKFPSNYMHLGVLYLAFPNATFIHARRHPVDTCLSIYMRPFFSINDVVHDRESIVKSYQVYLEQMEYWHAALPEGTILDVQYEDVVSQPETMIRKVIAHCKLEWEDACLNPEAGDRRVRTFSKWQVRQPVYTTSVARWKNYEPWLGVFRELLPDDSYHARSPL